MDGARKAIRRDSETTLQYALEKNPELASKIIAEMFDKVLDVINSTDQKLAKQIREVDSRLGKRINELSIKIETVNNELSKRINELSIKIETVNNELSKRINELSIKIETVNNELSKRISGLAEEISNLARVVATLAPTVGKLDRRYAKLEEMELRGTLEGLCFGGGFMVDRGVIAPGKPAVDVIISGKGLVALVEIAMKAGSRDINQLIKAARVYEEVYNVKPNILFLLSVEEPDKATYRRAESKGIIVTMRPGRILEILREKLNQ
ncbi:MAG: hypothetical protein QW534_03430 [Candidatus Methanomethylicia archaeon]